MLVAAHVQQLKSCASFSTPDITDPRTATDCLHRRAANAKGRCNVLRGSQHNEMWLSPPGLVCRQCSTEDCVCAAEWSRGAAALQVGCWLGKAYQPN